MQGSPTRTRIDPPPMVSGASARGKGDDQRLLESGRLTTCLLAARGLLRSLGLCWRLLLGLDKRLWTLLPGHVGLLSAVLLLRGCHPTELASLVPSSGAAPLLWGRRRGRGIKWSARLALSHFRQKTTNLRAGSEMFRLVQGEVSMAIGTSPAAATESPHWRPWFLPTGGHDSPRALRRRSRRRGVGERRGRRTAGQARGTTPSPAVAWASR